MEKEKVPVEEIKPKRKKKGKIASAFKLYKEGKSVKDIAEKMKISERLVRSYLWRAANPEKYKALLVRYFDKKKQKHENKKAKVSAENAP